MTLATADTYVAPAPVIDFVAPTPVIGHIAPAPTHVTPSEQFSPACTVTAVATGVNLDSTGLVNPQCAIAAVEASAPQIVSSVSHLEEFDAPVYNQIRLEQIVAECPRHVLLSTP